MDYLPALRARLTEPLARLGTDGVQAVISLMDDYDIIKDDYDNILELTKWPNSKDPLAHLDSKAWFGHFCFFLVIHKSFNINILCVSNLRY